MVSSVMILKSFYSHKLKGTDICYVDVMFHGSTFSDNHYKDICFIDMY